MNGNAIFECIVRSHGLGASGSLNTQTSGDSAYPDMVLGLEGFSGNKERRAPPSLASSSSWTHSAMAVSQGWERPAPSIFQQSLAIAFEASRQGPAPLRL